MQLSKLPLRYLIGRDADEGKAGTITVVGYDGNLPGNGIAAGYINPRDEKNSGQFGPYKPKDDIDEQYDEPAPVFDTEGFWRNFRGQVSKWASKGTLYSEIDNLDTYNVADALTMFGVQQVSGISVLVKNPNLVEGDKPSLIRHPAAQMMIVERDEDVTAGKLHDLRVAGGKPDLPIRVVAFGDGKAWAQQIAHQAQAANLADFGVTYDPSGGEYNDCEDILLPTVSAQPKPNMPSTLAQKIVAAAEKRGAPLDRGPGQINVIYVEGMDADGTPNRNRVNAFDDLRCVIDFVGGEPRILGSWEATTATGEQYTENPINDDGAAIIALGYQRAWQVGMHRGDHIALIQTGGPVRVARDKNKDYAREGDVVQSGWFGINQHWGYNQPKDDIGPASAGCLVGRTKDGHREFMKFVQADPRYLADSQFIFGTTVVTAKDVMGDTVSDTQSGFRSLTGGFYSTPDQTDQPASIRFNNPGAINGNATWVQQFQGFVNTVTIGGGNPIAVFYTPEQGVALWWTLLKRYAANGHSTAGGIIQTYGGGQDYSQYASFVAAKTGLSGDTTIDLNDDATLLKFGKAMFWYEAGRSTPLSDAQILYGIRLGRGDAPVITPPHVPPDANPPPDQPKPTDLDGAFAAVQSSLDNVQSALTNLKEVAMAQQPKQPDILTALKPLIDQLLPTLLPLLLPYLIQYLPQILGALFKQPAPPAQSQSSTGIGFWPGLLGTAISAFAAYKGWMPPDVAAPAMITGATLTTAAAAGKTPAAYPLVVKQ